VLDLADLGASAGEVSQDKTHPLQGAGTLSDDPEAGQGGAGRGSAGAVNDLPGSARQ
jgi:hypothetical protein